MLVADFCLAVDWRVGLRDGNPIYVFNFEGGGAQGVVFADDDAIVLRVNREDVDGLAGSEAEPFALADSVIVYAGVATDDRAVFGDDVAFLIVYSDAFGARVRVDELHVIPVRDEAEFHALRLFGDGEIRVAGDVAHFFLGQFTERKIAARELLLR